MIKTAVFTVIFPGNLKYFNDFLLSLQNQTKKDFDLLLVIDGIDEVDDHLEPYRDCITIIAKKISGSIPSIRQDAITWLKELNYDFIIFSDSDDRLAHDRVEVCCDGLSTAPMVVNDVMPFYGEEAAVQNGYWRNRMNSGQEFEAADLLYYNFAGLGNSAIRKEVLDHIRIPENLRAVDWFLFYQWMKGRKGIFLHDGCTLYRQHSNNTAGLKKMTKENIEKIIAVKISHYRALVPQFSEVESELKRHLKLEARIKTDPDFAREAVEKLNKKQINYFWWEETQYIHE